MDFVMEWYVMIFVKLFIGEVLDVMVLGVCFVLLGMIMEIKVGIDCMICY